MKKVKLVHNNENLSYFLTKKRNVKNINMRIKKDLNIYITAPYGVSLDYINEFVIQSTDYIKKARKSISQQNALSEEKRKLNEGIFFFLGKGYKKVFVYSDKKDISFEGDTVYIFGKARDKQDDILADFVKKEGYALVDTMLGELREVLSVLGRMQKPEIKLRKMKSRWGSCHCNKNKIVLNIELFGKDRECILYVLLHEICHFKAPNHSGDFYSLLEYFMPHWKEVKKRLNS